MTTKLGVVFDSVYVEAAVDVGDEESAFVVYFARRDF